MADEKISDMTSATSVADADVLPVVQGGTNKKATMLVLKTFMDIPPPGSAAWGDITGTLGDQTDLQGALDAKQPLDAQLTSVAALSYGGNANKVVRVNAGETSFELATITPGTGDVVGPGSATDNAITRFDSTTGKLVQDSAVTVDDTGALGLPNGVRQTFNPDGTTPGINVGAISGDPNTPSNGDLWYDSMANELTARVNGSNIALGDGNVQAVATLTTGKLVVGSAPSNINVGDLSGDVTTSGGTATTIANDAVTYAKQQNVSAASKLLGRGDSGSGDPQEITLGTNLAMSGTTLNATAGGSGTVTTTGSPATGNLAKFSGATSITNADLTGDVTTAGGVAATIANDAVTYAKLQDVSAASILLGRGSAGGSGNVEEITLGTNLTMSGTTLSAAGTQTVNANAPNSTIAINVLTGAAANIVSKAITIAAGDQVTIKVWGAIINNSGAVRTYAVRFNLGSLTSDMGDGTTIAASATNRSFRYFEVTFSVLSTSSAWLLGRSNGTTGSGLGTASQLLVSVSPMVAQHSASNLTGSQTASVQMFSNNNAATQSFELHAWKIEKVATNP